MNTPIKSWTPRRNRLRLGAGVISIATTFALVQILVASHPVVDRKAVQPNSVAVRVVPTWRTMMPDRPPTKVTDPERNRPKSSSVRGDGTSQAKRSRNVRERTKGAGDTFPIPAETAGRPILAPAEEPSSAPAADIRLDAKVIRQANAASKSAIQRMAQASGQQLSDDPGSTWKTFQGQISAAKQPDCIPTDLNGAGLLNVFIVPAMIALNRCKFSESR